MGVSVPLSAKSVTLDGSGDGTVLLDQVPLFQQWDIRRISVTVSGGSAANLGGEARVYKGKAIEANFVDGTETPWVDVATFDGQMVLVPPEQIRVVFSSCGAAQVATVTVHGDRSRL